MYRITEKGYEIVSSYQLFLALSTEFTCVDVAAEPTSSANVASYLRDIQRDLASIDDLYGWWKDDPEVVAEVVLELVEQGYLEEV